jgi:chemotaxis protein histidine kinase CheA/ActR/RegA family two-component response regulator
MSSSFDKFAILDSFLDEVGSYLPEIEANLDRLEKVPDDAEALEEAYRRTHTISGSASMMDFPGLSRVAHAMEDVLGDAFDEVLKLDQPAISLLRRSLERVRLLLAAIKNSTNDEDKIVAEDASEHAGFRQAQEAQRASASLMQEAIIVPSPDEEPLAPPVTFSALNDELSEWPAPQAFSSQTLAEQPGEAASASAALPDWLTVLGAGASAPPPPEAPPAQPEAHLPASEGQQGTTTRPLRSTAAGPGATPSRPLEFPTFEWPASPAGADSANGFQDTPHQESAWPSPLLGYQEGDTAPTLQAVPGGPEAAQPSLEEMLEAFRSPADGEWPEQPGFSASMPAASGNPPFQMEANPAPFTFVPLSASVPPEFELKAPVPPASPATPPPAAPAPRAAEPKAPRPIEPAAAAQGRMSASSPVARKENGQASPPLLAWQEVVEHESDLRRSAAALKATLASLRGVVASIEQERSELRSFLDGSKDAIDRLELWAGRAMGLDLRQSPDHVRRYLPLSVLWVVTTHLKKLLAGLKEATNGLSATEGEMSVTSAQLAEAVRNCGTFVSSMLAMAPQESGAGFSATLAHFSWTAPPQEAPKAVESVAPAAAPAAPAIDEAALREQVRLELEQQVRQEVERRVRAELEQEVRREESERIRQELELEMRRQILDQLAAQVHAAPPRPAASTASRPLMVFSPEPRPKRVVRATEQSEEALEVFRAEAEEHLQNIGMGVTALEHAPEDREVLQGIRRSTHTLKGAAAMMGFAHIADLSHISEDLLDQIMEGKVQVNKDVLSVILDTSEALEQLVLGKTGEHGGDAEVVEGLRKRYQTLLAESEEAEGEHSAKEQPAAVDMVEEATNEMLRETLQGEQQAGHALSVETSGTAVDKNELSVRIKLKKLDELVNLFGEQLVNRSILDEKLNRLLRMVADVGISSTRLRDVGGQLETRYEAAMLPSGRLASQATSQEGVTPITSTTRPLGRKALPPGRQVSMPLAGSFIGSLGDAGQATDFDELELDRYNEFHRLARGLSEGISDMTTLSSEMETTIRECEQVFQREMRLSSTFQDQLLKVRLVPLSTMVPRLYRAARAVALRLGKEIDLVMEGEETEVDRTVYEEVAGPLLHLVRNAVTHGIEAPETREAAGKPRAGTIKLSATYEGNQVIITVREDGAGIDAERVRNTAIARGLLDARSPLSEQSVLNLIFRPGFSTAEAVSEESGRGVGLDVVHDVVSRMRGTIEVESTPGEGTAWTMKFPISLQIQRAVLVRAANQTYAIPMALVEQITRLDYHPGTRALGVPGIEVRGEAYALTDLASLLALPPARPDDRASVLLIVSGRQRFALTVEGVVGKQEIVAKNLGPHLRQVKGVAGATVLGNGQVVLILEILELLEQLKTQSAASLSVVAPVLAHGTAASTASLPSRLAPPTWSSAVPTSNRGQLPTVPLRPEEQYVLVVDDSPSVRRVVSNMLKTAGWEVQTARDGMEAMEVAAKRTPSAVLLDIEMPRMDGYELMATLRSQDQFKHLPLIVLTSRAAAKHHQRAFQLGADAYLVKPYQDEELLKTLNTLVRGARA